MRNWTEAALPCQQAFKRARAYLQENEGVDALRFAGTNWATLHQSCRKKFQKATALNITANEGTDGSYVPPTTAVGRNFWIDEKSARWRWSRGLTNTRPRTNDDVGSTLRETGTRLVNRSTELHTREVYFRNRAKEITVWVDPAHGCASASGRAPKSHSRLVGWGSPAARIESKRSSLSASTNKQRESAQTSERSQLWRTSDLRLLSVIRRHNWNERGSRRHTQSPTSRRRSSECGGKGDCVRLSAATRPTGHSHRTNAIRHVRTMG